MGGRSSQPENRWFIGVSSSAPRYMAPARYHVSVASDLSIQRGTNLDDMECGVEQCYLDAITCGAEQMVQKMELSRSMV
jgi:hypothetical protein